MFAASVPVTYSLIHLNMYLELILVLADKEKVVSEAITDAGFTIEEVMVDGEWCAIAARG